MSTTYLNPASFHRTSVHRLPLCPKCGRTLREVDRIAKRGSVCLWYECDGPECEDRWFEKVPARMG
ncbi:MAG: hypothetical protein RBS72_14410 [Sedimentisphaerales bacterium]|nr:hypothetical protein [Sedimentisphaerales bacterium]HNY78774.1 hypothetical protein [Sedimentisphaerales bacterium]HOC63973.1 hypothetical protein [Sedimentisphaerales bacterium]HOH62897.1 hypothetical protein [Sedimentisphaerales bacterium]HPY51611.1 hypothetical protein [Sedimentisphaerales bacterium]